MRTAVIGHVEWVEFVHVQRVPHPGEIVHAEDSWAVPAGGGGVAAVQLAKLAGNATLFTALGDDRLGKASRKGLERLGVRVEAVFRPFPQRRGFTYIDAGGERTITTIGERLNPSGDDPLPWDDLAETGAVYFTAGDPTALHAARRARVVVATSRILGDLARAAVRLDAVVGSAVDPAEAYRRQLCGGPHVRAGGGLRGRGSPGPRRSMRRGLPHRTGSVRGPAHAETLVRENGQHLSLQPLGYGGGTSARVQSQKCWSMPGRVGAFALQGGLGWCVHRGRGDRPSPARSARACSWCVHPTS